MPLGRVKWFSNEKGYGFLEAVESKQDVFVHFSDIVMEGYKTLKEDAMVFFVLEQGAKGPGARHVCPLDESTAVVEQSGVGVDDVPAEASWAAPAESVEIDHRGADAPAYAGQGEGEERFARRKARSRRQSATA